MEFWKDKHLDMKNEMTFKDCEYPEDSLKIEKRKNKISISCLDNGLGMAVYVDKKIALEISDYLKKLAESLE